LHGETLLYPALTIVAALWEDQPQPWPGAVSKHSSLLLFGSCAASFCLARLFFVATGDANVPAIAAPPPPPRIAEAVVPIPLQPQTQAVPPPAAPIGEATAAIPAAAPSTLPPAESQPSPSAPADQGSADAPVKTDSSAPKAAADAPAGPAPSVEVATPSLDQAGADGNDPNAASPSPQDEADAGSPPVSASDEPAPQAKAATASPKTSPEPPAKRQDASRSKPEPRAMQLAPANEPIGRVSASGYGARVRSMLARHKPVAGARGSATVTFSIGRSGQLRSVRVSQSSGNARLDQMALATVRSAAPFPAPPANLAAGGPSYSIRIYFR
jgi:periplasmic protein TonB